MRTNLFYYPVKGERRHFIISTRLLLVLCLLMYSFSDLFGQSLFQGKLYNASNTPAFSTSNFKTLAIDKQNNVWAGSTGYGVSVFNGSEWEEAYNEFGNTGFIVRTMKTDPVSGNICVGMSKTSPCLGQVGGVYNYFNKNYYQRNLPPPPSPVITETSTKEEMLTNLATLGVLIDPTLFPHFDWFDFLEYYNGGLPSLVARSMDFNKKTQECWVGCSPQVCQPGYNGGIAVKHGVSFVASKLILPPAKNGDRFVTAITSDRLGFSYAAMGRSCGTSCEPPYIIKYDQDGLALGAIVGDESPSWIPSEFAEQAPLPLTKSSSSLAIRSLFVDSKFNIWVGGELNGLGVYVADLHTWVWLGTNAIPYPEGAIVNFDAITEGPDGTLYVGTNKGLLIHKGITESDIGTWKNFPVIADDGTILSHINNIKFDNSGNLWIATDQGIYFSEAIPPPPVTYYQDLDHDNFGNPNVSQTVRSTVPPNEYVINNTDCNDDPNNGGAQAHPGASQTISDFTLTFQNPTGRHCPAFVTIQYVNKACWSSYKLKITHGTDIFIDKNQTEPDHTETIPGDRLVSGIYKVKITDNVGNTFEREIFINVPECRAEVRYNVIPPNAEFCQNKVEIELVSDDCFEEWSAEFSGDRPNFILDDELGLRSKEETAKKDKKINFSVFYNHTSNDVGSLFSIKNVKYRVGNETCNVIGTGVNGIEPLQFEVADLVYRVIQPPSTICSKNGKIKFIFKTLNPCIDEMRIHLTWTNYSPFMMGEEEDYENIVREPNQGPFYVGSVTVPELQAGNYDALIAYYGQNVLGGAGVVALTLLPDNTSVSDLLTFTTTKTDIACQNNATGSVIANVTGGESPYSYKWERIIHGSVEDEALVEVSRVLTVQQPGDYALYVKDRNGCEINNYRIGGIRVNSLCPPPQPINANYADQMNGPNPEAKRVVVDKLGNAYVIGEYILTATFNSSSLTSKGANDVFIAKYSPSGELLWVTTSGSTGDDRATGISIDEAGENIFITGICRGGFMHFESPSSLPINRIAFGSSDYFVAKMDAETGNFLFAQMSGANSLGVSSDKISTGIATSSNGAIYVCGGIAACGNGVFGEDSIPGKILCDYPLIGFVAKYDSECKLIQAVIPVSNDSTCDDEMLTGIYIQPLSAGQDAGNIFVSGFASGKLNVGGHLIGEKGRQNSYYVEYDPLLFTGSNPAPAKVDWIPNGSGKSKDLVVDSTGFVYILHNIKDGDFTSCNSFAKDSLEDAYLTKFNNTGSGCLWNTRLVTGKTDVFESIALGRGDTIYVAGYTNGSPKLNDSKGFINRGGFDGFILKYDNNGNADSVIAIGGSGDDFVYDVTADDNGGIYTVGSLKNSLIVVGDDSLLSTNNETDGYIVSWGKKTPVTVTSVSSDTICKGEGIDILFNSTICNAGNIFKVQLSDKNGNFSSPLEIATLNSTTSGTVHAIIPETVPAGNKYHVRVISTDPVNAGMENKKDIVVFNPPPYYEDSDNDHFGGAILGNACTPPLGTLSIGGDCDDSKSLVYPGGTEVCNGFDDNCSGTIDEGVQLTFFEDADGDGYGNINTTTQACTAPPDYVADTTDCDDSKSSVHPGSSETCNLIDDNCNGAIDEGVKTTFYRDADGDGFGNLNSTILACTVPAGYVSDNADCNDGKATIYPGATEICNGIDDDCNGSIDEGVKLIFYRDADSDGFGNEAISILECNLTEGYATDNTDCDDGHYTAHPGATEICNGIDDDCNGSIDEGVKLTFYRDADGDGYGNMEITQAGCSPSAGFASNSNDCNDGSAAINPGAGENCNGIDDNCDGTLDEGCTLYAFYRDADGDGYGNINDRKKIGITTAPAGYVADSLDCNDNNMNIHPGVAETCNGIDDNCNGTIDEGVTQTYYRDADNDAYGDPAVTKPACVTPAGYTANNTDCNDNNASVRPGTAEVCNGIDDNCNGSIDEGVLLTFFRDADGDGYGNVSITTKACSAPAGYVANASDCNDASAAVRPGATEVCNGIDDNCNGSIDEGVMLTFFRDADGDGYGNVSITTKACSAPAGYVTNATDCNDASAAVRPGATEVCNGIDDNCNGSVDEGVLLTFFRDTDGDSFGTSASSVSACSAPAGYVASSTDCNDASAAIYPSATEICNGIDDNCNGTTDEGCDADGDGFTVAQGDCNDNNISVHPSATEVCNGIDDNCNGTIDEGVKTTFFRDADSDGFGTSTNSVQACTAPAGFVSNSTDCNDANANIKPTATEVCNGIDDNCNGTIDEGVKTTFFRDADSDGFGTSTNSVQACTAPAGFVSNSTDCNDANANIKPTATEVCNGIDDNCNGQIDEGCCPPNGRVTSNITATGARLNWTLVSGAFGYKVQYRKTGTSPWTAITLTTNVAFVNITGLARSTTYEWQVSTQCTGGRKVTYSSFSASVTFSTPAARMAENDSIDDELAEKVEVFPNPTPGKLTIKFNSHSTDKYVIHVIDITGRLMMSDEAEVKEGANLHDLDLSGFANGIYFITVQTTDYTQQLKVVVE